MSDSDTNGPGNASAPTLEACRQEIEGLHQFFEDWLGGTLPNTGRAFRRVRRALAPAFRLIHPSGEWRSREEILTGLRKGHASEPGLTIEITDVCPRGTGTEILAATYKEWQRIGGDEDGRLSTVVFARRPEGPSGLRWLHVHETWLRGPGDEHPA